MAESPPLRFYFLSSSLVSIFPRQCSRIKLANESMQISLITIDMHLRLLRTNVRKVTRSFSTFAWIMEASSREREREREEKRRGGEKRWTEHESHEVTRLVLVNNRDDGLRTFLHFQSPYAVDTAFSPLTEKASCFAISLFFPFSFFFLPITPCKSTRSKKIHRRVLNGN